MFFPQPNKPASDQRGSEFSIWFQEEATDLYNFFRVLVSLIPISIITSLLGLPGGIEKVFDNYGLLLSVVLQFIFMCYLLWRMVSKMNGDESSVWLKAPDKLLQDPDPKKTDDFFDALNFKSRKTAEMDEAQRKTAIEELRTTIGNAVKMENNFKYAWLSVWLIWLLLYIVKGIMVYGHGEGHHTVVSLLLVENLYNILVCAQIISFACCYFFLTNKDERHRSQAPTVNWRIFVLLFVVLGLCICISAFSKFEDFKHHQIMSGIFLLKIFRNTLLSAFFALMVVKLLAEDLRSPFWIKLAVFLYVATIPLFVIFSDMPEVKHYLLRIGGHDLKGIMDNVELILYNIAWFFKFCIFLFVAWLIENDHLLFYFLRFRESNDEVVNDRQTVDDLLKA